MWLRKLIMFFTCFCVLFIKFVALSKLMQNKFGNTALITACEQGNIECATVLLKHRANVNYQNKVRLLCVHGQHG